MGNTKRVGELEVAQDIQFQKAEWTVERVGWAVMGLIFLLALFGLFGDGPLSYTTQKAANSEFQVTYERFNRLLNRINMQVVLPPAAVQENQASFWVDQQMLDRFNVEGIFPQPASVTHAGNRIIYTFDAQATGQPLPISFQLRPQKVGRTHGQLGWGQEPPLSISQFIFP